MALSGVDVATLLAFGDRIPNLEARALSPTIGWLALTCVLAFVGVCLVNRERFARLWMRAEDPRTMGVFRIAFGLALLANLAGMAEQLEFLFTDEGLFTTEQARRVLGRKQFAGYGEGVGGEVVGFFDAQAWWAFLKGPRYSLLMFRSDPTFFWIHLWVYVAVVVAFIVGFRTRTMAVLGFLLMGSLTMRNPIYWTGADVVYRVMFFLMILTRSGHAYSVDNWLRCRRLRREGRLSEPGGPGGGAGLAPSEDHPEGLEAIYRRIPAWPRLLMMMQLATIYFYTGCAKTGKIWAQGDSLFYALQLDHFYRTPPQLLASVFGTNLFKLFTWVVHFWQIGFPLMLVGLVIRWQLREGLPAIQGWRKHATRLLWTAVGLSALGVVVVATPVHYTPSEGWPTTEGLQWIIAGSWVAGMVLLAWLWRRLRDRPFVVRVRGHEATIDLDFACRWLFGRRLWLTIGLFFHVQIFMLMNIGMFAPIMIVVYIVCLNGTETASVLRSMGHALGRLKLRFIPADVAAGAPAVPPEDPDLPHLQRKGLPDGAPPWAYGRLGRILATSVVVMHIGSIALWSIPDKDSCHAFRKDARKKVEWWLNITGTRQSWNMFSPNPIRTNVFLEVLVTDADGEVWDLRTDANSPRNKALPWIFYDRAGKITRRVNGDGKWYRKWVARYHCRQWALDHDGRLPKSVELRKVWYKIPSPKQVAKRGFYRPAELLERAGHEKSVVEVRCAVEADAQPTNELRRRHGLPEVDEDTIRHRVPRRKASWERKKERKAKGDRHAKK